MQKIDQKDVAAALDMLSASGMDAAWELSTIESDEHAIPPLGKGRCVTLHSTRVLNIRVWQKASSFEDAMRAAIDRLGRREAGEKGA